MESENSPRLLTLQEFEQMMSEFEEASQWMLHQLKARDSVMGASAEPQGVADSCPVTELPRQNDTP